MKAEVPAWVRELDLSLVTHPQILLVGNVRDTYFLPAGTGSALAPFDLPQVVERSCRLRGFAALAVFDIARDRLDVWRLRDGELPLPDALREFIADDALSAPGRDGGSPDDLVLRRTRRVLREIVTFRTAPIGMLFPFAARLGSPRAELTGEGKLLMAAAEALAHEARTVPGSSPVMPYNTVFWVAEREEQLPVEFAISPRTVKVITIPAAPVEQRLAAARHAVTVVMSKGTQAADQRTIDTAAENLVSVTHGMSNAEVLAVSSVAIDRGLPVSRLDEAARLYRVGVRNNPWAASSIRKIIAEADPAAIGVIGQDRAVRKAVEIFMRSAAGLTGAQSSSSPNRPRGVLFLAGPTGVGKTELAKGVARLIFGRDAEPVRFDMSEFQQEHARERLVGAPPGYVGFDAGGELTNAVRANPMSVLLFDEIDKAHERLFDLFLQVLEDGRLTDGRGSTVHFTESVLIFTSNLGVTDPMAPPGAPPRFTYRDDPAEVRRVLQQSFESFFDNKIGRPELRNRLGDAFIAMDFIQPEIVPALLEKALSSVARRMDVVHRVRLEIGQAARRTLYDRAIENLGHGGRGVNNAVETTLINPLSEMVLREPPALDETWRVDQLVDGTHGWRAEVTRC
ncbi:AAA family ATPase [Lentzea sp. BCCO 10_0798]|uniref:AAA family ATPase n=1 Tax=Lentzea kristufekii TaxID=3095430 RepID=A0ABU4TN51_9PSEU|nr:AAA family ATPase [Lentzea sp. BCCO 10_0798]MDX8049715.1 AAA family ATPase [Lentzea sp. BCCO 10_0798]